MLVHTGSGFFIQWFLDSMVLSGNSGPKVALTHSDWAEFIDYTLEHHKYSSLQDAGYFIGEPKDHVEFRSTTDSGMSGGAASGGQLRLELLVRVSDGGACRHAPGCARDRARGL